MVSAHKKLSVQLMEAGIDNDIFRLNKRWSALKIASKLTNHEFWIRHSSRGWFLGDRDVFHIPNPSNVLGVCTAWATEVESRSRMILSFGLELQSSWIQDEFASEEAIWQLIGWRPLSDSECTVTFDDFENKFAYPSERFSPPPPALIWDFSHFYACDLEEFDHLSEQLNNACLLSLRQSLATSEELIAIDWNHCCYRLESGNALETGAPELWPVSVFPDGDYHMFVAQDFRLGIVADPSGGVCAYGGQMPQNMTVELDKSLLKSKPQGTAS